MTCPFAAVRADSSKHVGAQNCQRKCLSVCVLACARTTPAITRALTGAGVEQTALAESGEACKSERTGKHAMREGPGQEYALGTRVRMLFDDGIWWAGVLTKFHARSQTYVVTFEDGSVEETSIPDEDLQLVPLDEQKMLPTPVPSGGAAAASGKRTQLRKCAGTPAATPDIRLVADTSTGATATDVGLRGLSKPLAFSEDEDDDEMQSDDCGTASGDPQPAAHNAGVLFSLSLAEAVAQGTFAFESAMENLHESVLAMQAEDVTGSLPALAVGEVMLQASEFISAMLQKEERRLASEDLALPALQGVSLTLTVLACQIEHIPGQMCCKEDGSIRDGSREDLMDKTLQLFGACLRSWSMVSMNGPSKRAKDADKGLSDELCHAASACLQALARDARDASNERHCLPIMKLSIHALLCDILPMVQMEGIKLLKDMFSKRAKHRESILDEIFFLLDDERVGRRRGKKPKGIKVPSSVSIHIQPVSAALLLLLQSIPAASARDNIQNLEDVKRASNYFLSLFERRFAERASLKGKDAREEMKDSESRSVLTDLMDDVLAVFGLPHWGIAEDFFSVFLLRLDLLTRKPSDKIAPAHKAMVIDILSASFLGLVRFSHRVQALELEVDLSEPFFATMLEKQQDDVCTHVCEFTSGDSVEGPIKLARSQQGAAEQVLEERMRQVVLNFLEGQSNFARPGVCRDAFMFLLMRWSSSAQHRSDDGEESSQGSHCTQKGEEYWGAQFQLKLSLDQHAESSLCLQTGDGCIAQRLVEVASCMLVLRSSLLAKLQNRFSRFLLNLMNDTAGSDKAKVLRVVKDIASLEPKLLHDKFLERVGNELLCDDNANLRASAVELLSNVCLGKMRQMTNDEDTKQTFDVLSARRNDISVKVRQSVVGFLHEATLLSRPASLLLASEQYPRLVSAHINKHTAKGEFVTGRVMSFDPNGATFKIEFAPPDHTPCSSSSSQNDYAEVQFEVLKDLLVLETDPDESVKGDASHGFHLRQRFVSAALALSGLLLTEEESVLKPTRTALQELWFTAQHLPPVNICVEEIVATVNACNEPARNGVCFEILLSQLPLEAISRAKQYVDLLFAKVSAIENVSPINSPGSGRPASFNDFDARARLLQPVLHALKPFAKKMPALVFPHLSKMLPIISTMELSTDHRAVLRLLLDILIDVACSHKSADQVRRLSREVKDVDSEKDLSACNAPKMPPAVEAGLLKSFVQGAFKLSDTARWTSLDDLAKVTQAFCAVVECNRTPSSIALLLKVFRQYIRVLQVYVEQPTDERANWIPRTLVMAGCMVRYFDVDSVKETDLSEQDSVLVKQSHDAKQRFFVYAVAHFANNNQEKIKCSCLHALGSVFVREPKLMLNKAVVHLMTKCLRSEEPPAHQLAVLRNLHEHFVAEEADLVARTSVGSPEAGSVSLVSDTSTSIMHRFHSLILEASLSPHVKVRQDAVLLIKTILHRGLTASYLCIPFLLAQQCQTDHIADKAMRILRSIYEREASQFTPNVLWDGVEKAFRICPSSADLPLHAFHSAFILLVGNDKEKASKIARQFLSLAIRPFDQLEHSQSNKGGSVTNKRENSLEFKAFVAKLLAQLPYQSMDSVLFLIKLLQDRATSLGGSCIEGLGRSLATASEEDDHGLPEMATGLNQWVGEAQVLSVLVQLDKFLQDVYSIKKDRVSRFLTDSKTMDKCSVKESSVNQTPFDISIHFAHTLPIESMALTAEARKELRSQYKSLRDLMRANFATDAMPGVDFNLDGHGESGGEQPKVKTTVCRARGASAKSKKNKTQPEDMDEGADADADADFQRDEARRKKRVRASADGAKGTKKRAKEEDAGESDETVSRTLKKKRKKN